VIKKNKIAKIVSPAISLVGSNRWGYVRSMLGWWLLQQSPFLFGVTGMLH